jgi:hypothetical protein
MKRKQDPSLGKVDKSRTPRGALSRPLVNGKGKILLLKREAEV